MFGQTTTLYNIPIEHLDYKYITQCNKLKELEKILKVLRSGSEGRYPELEAHCEEKIRSMDPDNRLLRKPEKLLSTAHLPKEEREEVEDEFQKWLEETKRNEAVAKLSIPILEDPAASPGIPAVRSEGCILGATGKGKKRVTSTIKSSKPRTYEEWAKIEKELEKELEDQEHKNNKGFEGAAGDSSIVKPSCAGLAAKAQAMPLAVRRIHAQREKEKGNEALQAGDNQEALGYYNRSLIYHPTAAVYNNRALLYLKTKKWKLAVNDCNRVLKEEPQNVKALFRRARAFYEIHSLEKAEADLNEVLAIEPDNQKSQNLLKVVREEHAKRQRSNIEGGRRMVIEEDESEEDDDEEEEEEDEEEADHDDANAEEELAAEKEAERRRREAETRAAMESARNRTPSSSYSSTSTKPVESSSRNAATRYKGPQRTAYGDSSPVRRGVILEEVTDDSEEEVEQQQQEQEKMHGLQNVKKTTPEPSIRSAEEKSPDISNKLATCTASKRTQKAREPSQEENKREVASEEVDPELKVKKRRAKLIRRLKSIGPENLNTMLDIKLDAQLLEDYIYGLQTICLPQTNEHEFIYKVLEGISRSPRFGIACLLLDAEAAGAARMLLDELKKSPVSSQLDVEKLQQKYIV